MDNASIPPVQQVGSPQGGSVDMSGWGMNGNMQGGVMQPSTKEHKFGNVADLVKTIAIIALSLISVTFIGLFIWKTMECEEVQTDVQARIDAAVVKAKDEQASKLEADFTEREKYPFKTFSGPVDYGQLSFQYPKTWSVYVADPATNGGDFHAYFNPVQVDTVSEKTVNALRVSIVNKAFDVVVADYQRAMSKKDANLTVQSVTVNGITANRYTGTIPGTELSGFIIVFKIRDKTAIVQTDSVLFADDYNKLIETITFNA